jgi:protein-S-isoprenylcysteine O-methyltransferase Ste14
VERPTDPVRIFLLLLALVVLLSAVAGLLSVLLQRVGVPGWLVTVGGMVATLAIAVTLGLKLAAPRKADLSESPSSHRPDGSGPS